MQDLKSNVMCGLNTAQSTISSTGAGLYSFHIHVDMLPGSGLSVVINRNGSPIATATSPAPQANHVELQADNIQCAANDVITWVLSSSVAIDGGLNNVKSTIWTTRLA